MNKFRNAGYTILEFMIASMLAIPLVLLIAQVLSSTHLLLFHAYERKKHTTGSLAVYRSLERVMLDLDSHPFFLLPRVHKNGQIQFTDGSSVIHNTIAAKSSGVTSVRLVYTDILQLSDERSLERSACLLLQKSGTLLSKYPIRNILLITPTGLYESGIEIKQKESASCYRITLHIPGKSMITPIPDIRDIEYAYLAIPIQWIQTTFRDSKRNLRIFRFSGNRIILNQPIARDVPEFELKLIKTTITGHYELILSDTSFSNLAFEHFIPRTDYRNILWNMPHS